MDQQMRYFIAVVDEHSFTKAAVSCNISQSAISQQIKELEQRLGVQLLKRAGRSFSVTPTGDYFYRHAKQIIRQLDQLIEQTKQIDRQRDEYTLRLGYLQNFGTQEFLQAVAQFSARYPKVNVKITSGMHEELFKLLRDDQLDLDFADQRRALSSEYHNFMLTETDFMVMIPKNAFSDKQANITTADLSDWVCILPVGTIYESAEENYYRDALGIRSPFRAVTTFDEGQALVAANQGFMIVNSNTAKRVDQQVNRILPLLNGNYPLHQKYYAYWKQDNSGYYIEKFAEILKQQFNDD